ncbi:MAG: hypothetical protein RIT03_1902 [Bacteroidota bacterium]|jgi:hypothetical protein
MIHSQNETDPIINEEVTPEEDIVPVTKNSWLNPTNDLGKLESGFVLDDAVYSTKQTQTKTTRFTIRNRK